jgi:hypothetical protein
MEDIDPDFEYPHHKEIANQLRERLKTWSKEDENKSHLFVNRIILKEIIADLDHQVEYYEKNQSTIQLPDLSHLVEVAIEEDTYIIFYAYKMMRQSELNKRLSASEIIMELIDKYEKSHPELAK